LRLLGIMLKYKPWRVKLVRLWLQHHSASGSPDDSANNRDRIFLEVLRELCKQMDGHREVRVWGLNLGGGVSRATGPVAFLNLLGVLRSRSSSAVLMLGGGAKLVAKRLCRGVRESGRAVTNLEKWVNLADALGEPRAPRTCEEWIHQQQLYLALFKKHRVLYSGEYVVNYVVRALLLGAMHRNGISRLFGTAAVGTKQFFQSFPDSKRWTVLLPRRGHNGCVQEFLLDLKYTGRPELATMHMCLLLTREMWMSPSWYREHRRSLTRRMHEGSGHLGLQTLPAICVREELAKSAMD